MSHVTGRNIGVKEMSVLQRDISCIRDVCQKDAFIRAVV